MGTAEISREIGDAGDPLLIGVVATASTLGVGLAVFAGVAAFIGIVTGALTPKETKVS